MQIEIHPWNPQTHPQSPHPEVSAHEENIAAVPSGEGAND